MTIKTKAPRWYQWKDGQIIPCYELPKKSGSGMKAYSLREARELHLIPSVTSVLSVIDKPELDNWRVSQAIHSALTLPRLPDEGEDAFAERVLADAEAQANKAAEFGTRIHDAIAAHLTDISKEPDPDLVPYLMPFADWALENIQEVHSVERCVGSRECGIAGRMDLDCTLKGIGRVICDFKSQQIKDGKARFWSDWCPQLAAYSMCCFSEDVTNRRIASVVISSNEPGPVNVRVWTEEEFEEGWKLFNNALGIWIILRGKGYDPRVK